MDWQTVAGLIARHSLTTLGGFLAAHGWLPDGTTSEQFVGAGMVLIGVVWSWWQKRGHALAIEELAAARDYWHGRAKESAPGGSGQSAKGKPA